MEEDQLCPHCGFLGTSKEYDDHDCGKSEPIRTGYTHVLDPDWREPETTLTTASFHARFDPFEALDTIDRTIKEDDELDRTDADMIQRQVDALRAYITGLES